MQTNEIYCGNAKEVLLNKFTAESVDLIYMDPPFFSNRNYELVWGNGFELKAYEDRWQGGIENYIAWMEPILMQCHRVLKPTGSLYLHCDWHACAHLRILLDRIFGERNFLNEIVWWYHDPAGTVKNRFKKKHDTILFFAKEYPKQTFNCDDVRTPYKEGTLNQDKEGYRSFGRTVECHPKGKIREDVWEVPIINSQSKERLGYPTQKPEALLEIILRASSNEGDVVLDPMCGGGTTLAVAQKLRRQWTGIDVSPLACKKTESRLRLLGASPKLLGMPMSMKALRALQPFMFQQWVVEKLYAHPSRTKVGDMGIDGYMFDGTPIQVKQSEGVGRNVVDNFETAIRRLKKTSGTIIAFSFGKGAYEEIARAKNNDSLNINLMTIADILDGMGAHEAELEALDWVSVEKRRNE